MAAHAYSMLILAAPRLVCKTVGAGVMVTLARQGYSGQREMRYAVLRTLLFQRSERYRQFRKSMRSASVLYSSGQWRPSALIAP
jgi:hypothetical protein